MSIFDFVTDPTKAQIIEGDQINDMYFTVDTADLITVHRWFEYNPYIITYALDGDEIKGFFNVIPITARCAQMFERQELKEEDLDTVHMVHPKDQDHACFAYVAAIAVKDRGTYRGNKCVAAMISGMVAHFLTAYNRQKFTRIFANPTTFDGNNIMRRFGFQPLYAFRKPLRAGNDIYVLDINDQTIARMQELAQRYQKFIGQTPWQGEDVVTKMLGDKKL